MSAHMFVSMCTHACVCVYVYVHVSLWVLNACVDVCGHTCVCVYACLWYMPVYLHAFTCVSLCTQTSLHVRVCAHMCVCMCTCVSSLPPFFPEPKLQASRLYLDHGERGVEMQISDKCYLRCHLVSPRRESKWRTVPNHVKDKSASAELPGLCGVHPEPPHAGTAAARGGPEQRGPRTQK